MRESELERKLKKAVEDAGGLCWKFTSPGTRGVPDRMCVFPNGKIVLVELKAKNGKLSPLQLQRIKELAHREVYAWVIDSEEKLQRFIKRYVGGDAV